MAAFPALLVLLCTAAACLAASPTSCPSPHIQALLTQGDNAPANLVPFLLFGFNLLTHKS